jgi:hypothetical protein
MDFADPFPSSYRWRSTTRPKTRMVCLSGFLRPQWTRLPGGAGTEAFRRRMVAVREYRRRTHDYPFRAVRARQDLAALRRSVSAAAHR